MLFSTLSFISSLIELALLKLSLSSGQCVCQAAFVVRTPCRPRTSGVVRPGIHRRRRCSITHISHLALYVLLCCRVVWVLALLLTRLYMWANGTRRHLPAFTIATAFCCACLLKNPTTFVILPPCCCSFSRGLPKHDNASSFTRRLL